jgi:hypothetical protein
MRESPYTIAEAQPAVCKYGLYYFKWHGEFGHKSRRLQ